MPTPKSQTVSNAVEQKVGIVVSVDREKGILTLWHSDGPCSYFNYPSRPGDLRIGSPVEALVEGRIVWTLRRL